MLSTIIKSLIISYLVGCSNHGSIKVDEFIVIPQTFSLIPSAHMAVIEFKFGDEIKRPCQIYLENPCHSVIEGCQCKQTFITTELNITYRRTSVKYEERYFRTITYDSNGTEFKGAWQHFPKINDTGHNDTDLKQATGEDTKCYQVEFGITASALFISTLILSILLLKRGPQAKILKDQPIKFRYKDTESGRQDVSQDVNKRSQKMLNLTDATKPEDKDDHSENDRGLATVRTYLLGEDLSPGDAGTGRDDIVNVNKIE